MFAVNVKGLFFTLQAVAKRMIARGPGGKIINMASQAGRRGEALVAIYCASKAAVISLTQSAGLDLIKHRINVNGIAPGVVDTPMWDRGRCPVRQIRASPARREEAPGRRGRPVRAHGIAGGPRRRRRVPRLVGQRLRRRADAERRRRQLDELTTSPGGFEPMYLDRFNLKGRVAVVTGGGAGDRPRLRRSALRGRRSCLYRRPQSEGRGRKRKRR